MLHPDMKSHMCAMRSSRYGLEFIRFALYQVWYGRRMVSYLRGYRVTSEFERHVRGLSKGTMK